MLILILMTFLSPGSAAENDNDLKHICGKYYFKKSELFFNVSLDKNEKLFVCGSDTPGWQNIPQAQAITFIENFLRNKGYYQPTHQQINGNIVFDPGEKTVLKEIHFENKPDNFADVTFIGAIGKVLNSKLLDEIESWSIARLKAVGYPCPQARVRASYENQIALVTLQSGKRAFVSEILRQEVPELHPKTLSRFDAIREGDLYNGDYFTLTSRRVISSGLVNYSYFKNNCNQEGEPNDQFKQEVLISKPRYLILAGGASTEEFPVFQVTWRHSRLDERASMLFGEAYFSSLEQSLSGEGRIYLFNNYPRFFFTPNINIERISESVFKAVYQRYGAGIGYVHDSQHHQYILKTSPVYNFEKTLEGVGPENTNYLSFNTSITLVSNYYEFFQTSPRTGYRLQLEWISQQQGLGSDISSNLFRIEGTYLWNMGKYDPPILVMGARFGLSSFESPSLQEAPQSFRLYLGGNDDLRGFARKSINNGNQGYMTTSYLGLESRFVSILPYSLQPFLFFDIGRVGLQSFSWIDVSFLSPGLGLRWQSPFGAFRVTASHGFVEQNKQLVPNVKEEWTFFFSYGREF